MVIALKEKTMVMTMALSTKIEELELKEFVGIRSVCDVDNFFRRMKNYFCARAKGIVDDVVKGQFYPEFTEEEARAKLQGIIQRGTVGEYVREFKELML
ncbi:hypothetical protein Goklo_007758 [Gossypium klotzschianum]|uniref:Retrotransposon gag domain-containing protein n=1 Tax=Gossypium klotzschianum TaxID=34286 RepID=A0A7J8UXN3_9ROSI|nr:hypothetical protein [Gossypium klotzschianum]